MMKPKIIQTPYKSATEQLQVYEAVMATRHIAC